MSLSMSFVFEKYLFSTRAHCLKRRHFVALEEQSPNTIALKNVLGSKINCQKYILRSDNVFEVLYLQFIFSKKFSILLHIAMDWY